MKITQYAASLIVLWTIVVNAISTASAQGPPPTQWAKFEKNVNQLRLDNHIPGLAIAVVADGQLLGASGFGYADNNNEIPVTPDTPFWAASITKTFVGLAFLHLKQQDKVDFDELARDTPKFTGLCEWLASSSIVFAERLNCKADITIGNILNHQVNGKPGSEFMYNPIMYSRLSRYLEHKLGEGVDEVEGRHNYLGQTIDKLILEPADMQRTVASMWDRSKMTVFFDMADGFSVGERRNKTKLRRPDKHIAGGAGVVSTVLDLAKYDIALGAGNLGSKDIMSTLLKPVNFNDGTESPYGYGWYFQCHRGARLMWHAGWDPDAGYSSLLLRLPERNLTLAVLANSGGMWWGNPLDKAQVESSDFADLFFKEFVFNTKANSADPSCANAKLNANG